MKKVIIASSLLVTSAAFAADYKFNVEGRADMVSQTQTFKPVTGADSKNKDMAFKFNRVRLNMTGTVNDQLSFRLRYAPLTAEAALRDSSFDKLELYYVDHKNSMFTARLGKQQNAEIYGRESIASGSDMFLNTRVQALHSGNLGTYKTGASFMFNQLENQTFTLNLHTPNKTATDGSFDKKNTGMGMGVYYSGSVMDKMILPVFAYTMDTQNYDGAGEKNVTIKTMNLGARFSVAGFAIDTDYKTYERPEYAAAAAKKKYTSKSMYANVAYTMNEWTPFVTYINDKFTTDETNAAVTTGTATTATDTDYKRNAIGAGVFWKPIADVNFRYHAVYTTDTTEYEGQTGAGINKIVDNKIYLGFKADI